MLKETWQCLRVFVAAHKLPLALWLAAQLVLIVLFRAFGPTEDEPNVFLGMSFFVAFAVSSFAYSVYLGLAFNSRRRDSWLRQLPFSSGAALLCAQALLALGALFYFVAFFDIWRQASLSVFVASTIGVPLFFLPMLNFHCVRRARTPLLGAFAGAVVSAVLVLLHAYLLYEWNQAYPGFVAELPGIALLAVVGLLLEREHRAATLAAPLAALAVCGTLVLHAPFSRPQSLEDAVVDLKVLPTPWAIANFRTYATDSTLWRTEPGRDFVHPRVNAMRQDLAAAYLNADEQRLFLANILAHADNFNEQKPRRSPYTFTDPFPLVPRQLEGPAREQLLASWVDDEAHCYFLPSTYERRVLEVMFASSACGDAFLRLIGNTSFPHLSDADAATLTAFLKLPRGTMPPKLHDTVRSHVAKFGRHPEALTQDVLSDDAIADFRRHYAERARKRAAGWLELPREEFIATVAKASVPQRDTIDDPDFDDDYRALQYLCRQVSSRCSGDIPHELRGNLGYLIEKRLRLRSIKGSASWAERVYQLGREVARPEHWDALSRLRPMMTH